MSDTSAVEEVVEETPVEDATLLDNTEIAEEETKDEDDWVDDGKQWYSGFEGDGVKRAASDFENREAFLKSIGMEASDDWRGSITDEKLREHANRYNSVTDITRNNLDMRTQLSGALVPLKKGATDEEKTEYVTKLNKMLGVPAEPTGYEFPDNSEDGSTTEEQDASRERWQGVFHANHVPKQTADALLAEFSREAQEAQETIKKADDAYVAATEAQLRSEWPNDEYDANKTIAARAARELFGGDFEDMMEMTTSKGQLLMDSAPMVRMMAKIGREMSEGNAELMTAAERETVEDQIADLRSRSSAASAEGNNRLANKLYQEEQELLGKLSGNKEAAA